MRIPHGSRSPAAPNCLGLGLTRQDRTSEEDPRGTSQIRLIRRLVKEAHVRPEKMRPVLWRLCADFAQTSSWSSGMQPRTIRAARGRTVQAAALLQLLRLPPIRRRLQSPQARGLPQDRLSDSPWRPTTRPPATRNRKAFRGTTTGRPCVLCCASRRNPPSSGGSRPMLAPDVRRLCLRPLLGKAIGRHFPLHPYRGPSPRRQLKFLDESLLQAGGACGDAEKGRRQPSAAPTAVCRSRDVSRNTALGVWGPHKEDQAVRRPALPRNTPLSEVSSRVSRNRHRKAR